MSVLRRLLARVDDVVPSSSITWLARSEGVIHIAYAALTSIQIHFTVIGHFNVYDYVWLADMMHVSLMSLGANVRPCASRAVA